MQTPHSEFQILLRQWSIYFRLRRSFTGGLYGLIFGLVGALVFSLYAFLSGFGLRYGLGLLEFISLLLMAAMTGIALASAGAFFWPVKIYRVTRLVDASYQLLERFTTAAELVSNPENHYEGMASHQLADTIQRLQNVRPTRSFWGVASRSQWLTAAALTVAAILVIAFGQPYFQQAAQRKIIRQAIQNEVARLEELQQAIENDPDLTPEEKARLTETLQETVRKLEQAESLEQAVAALSETEQELRAADDTQIQDQAEALRQLGNQILQSEDDPAGSLEEFGQALVDGDPIAAAQALQNMDVDSMSAEQRQALSEQLKKAAEAIEDSNPDLSQALDQAAQALENNDTTSAQQALDQAAGALNQAGSQMAQASAIQEAANQAGEGAERLIQAGRSSQQAGASATGQQGQSSGQGSGQEDGQSDNQGSGQANDSSGSGSGSGKGSSDQGDGSGTEAGSAPIDQGNGPGDGGERPFVPLTDAQRLGGSGSTDVFLPESGVPGEETLAQGNSSPGVPGGSTVPYLQIYPAYAEAYRQAIESGVVPPALRSLVQKYFSNLEP